MRAESQKTMTASTNPQALRRLLHHMDGITLAKAERISRTWQLVMSEANWRWRQLSIKDIPQELRSHVDQDGDWRGTYHRWQPALCHLRSHPYYLYLELDHSAEFLQTLRKDLTCRKLLDNAELRHSAMLQRGSQLKGLGVLSQRAHQRAREVQELQQKAKQEPSNPLFQQQLQRKQRQLMECFTCSGCGVSFQDNTRHQFTGPLVLDGCHHPVCTSCCQLPECPKCKTWVDKVPPKGDQEVQHWAKRLAGLAAKEESSTELFELSAALLHEVSSCKCRGDEVLLQVKRLQSSLMTDKLTRMIGKAFQHVALVHHPDHGGSETRFIEIQSAAMILRNPVDRAAYDKEPHHVFLKARAGPQESGRIRRGPLMITDFRPSMPQIPRLSLEEIQKSGVYGWRMCCIWNRTRGPEATRYRVEWKQTGDTDWSELALVTSSSVQSDGRFEIRSPMVYSAGQCLCRVTAGNDNGWGPSSMEVAIDVLPPMTSEQRKKHRQSEAAELRRQQAAETQQRARQKENELCRLEKRELRRLCNALEEVDASGDLSAPRGMLALSELVECVSKCRVLTAQTEQVAQASAKLQEHRHILLALESMPQVQRTEMLQTARSLRRSNSARNATGIDSTTRKQVTSVELQQVSNLIAERVRSVDIEVAAHVYLSWLQEINGAADELGLYCEGEVEANYGWIRVSSDHLGTKGEQLWAFLSELEMLPPSKLEASCESEQSSDSDAEAGIHEVSNGLGNDDGVLEEDEEEEEEERDEARPQSSGQGITRAWIQMLALETLARQICEAAAKANPQIRRLLLRGDSEEPEQTSSKLEAEPKTVEVVCASEKDETSEAEPKKRARAERQLVSKNARSKQLQDKRSKPKPALSAFQCFVASVSPDEGTASYWKALSKSERKRYEEESERDQERHRRELDAWQAQQARLACKGKKERRCW
eukprot:TRINITY_DN21101_c1_g1_i1.p1 TRINITY_DN21101_c1_g1~~TRINITY_DN21101_c1_g1_i1.p1  ORF type:complete len:936 (+),score=173.52 TRINITY_DN21101_c1_g1_i1:79-2886(+)